MDSDDKGNVGLNLRTESKSDNGSRGMLHGAEYVNFNQVIKEMVGILGGKMEEDFKERPSVLFPLVKLNSRICMPFDQKHQSFLHRTI